MPGISSDAAILRKRKSQDAITEVNTVPSSKMRKIERKALQNDEVEEEILLLESRILESRKHYNKIHTLLRYCQECNIQGRRCIIAAVALCRVFCRLLAIGNLSKPRDAPETEIMVAQWLQNQLELYKTSLLDLFAVADPGTQSTALTLLMRLLKDEAESVPATLEKTWRERALPILVARVASSSTAHVVRKEFVEKYLQPYEDIRHYGFACLSELCDQSPSKDVLDGVVSILGLLEPNLEKEHVNRFYVAKPQQSKYKKSYSTAHRKQAQDLWLNILKSDLTKAQRKVMLNMMANQIAPWFTRPELLMDFLTDSFNAGGSISLAALSGLFHLMQERNLDYPQFYSKLYSLLTSDILHSKRRSHFFRLLNTFMSSTHLPAALVASFIKRLSRLTIFAPPSGIVAVIPWIYNLLKDHPSCTCMIHRKSVYVDTDVGGGMDDPYDMEESDPMETNAIESSLWEIQTLQAHYHPNVATIAKIISEQFTKQAYNLEDFLDHSYSSMLIAELSKEIKKPPVIEYEIPKKIFFQNPDSPDKDSFPLEYAPGSLRNLLHQCATMTLRDLLKRREKIKEDAGQSQTAEAQSPPATEFTFMRTDTNTQEVISPPTFADDYKPQLTKDTHTPTKRFSRFRSASNASSTSNTSTRGEKRLSHRLHLGSHSRSSSISSNIVPGDLPPINDEVGEGDEKEAQWENRATILAQENPVAKQGRPRENSLTGPSGRPTVARAISDAKGDENIQEAIRLHEAGGMHSREIGMMIIKT
ncbi:MAG: hypothetical protein Q9170_000387 [Blastenia crenularia]